MEKIVLPHKPNTLEYEERIVAFLDILGFKNRIAETHVDKSKVGGVYSVLTFLGAFGDNGKNDWSVDKILNSLPFVKNTIDDEIKKYDITKITKIVNCTCFSDSIVVSVPYDNKNIHYRIFSVIANLLLIGGRLLQGGVLLRGGVTIGKIIHKTNSVVMGPAMIEAYEMECKEAVYPRVILSDKLGNMR